MFQGKGVFDFTLIGSVLKIDDVSKAVGKCKDKIIILRDATPDVVLLFHDIKGILCEHGGLTCHLALLAREMSIPCVVGVQGIFKVADGTNLYIQSVNGVGTINENFTI